MQLIINKAIHSHDKLYFNFVFQMCLMYYAVCNGETVLRDFTKNTSEFSGDGKEILNWNRL